MKPKLSEHEIQSQIIGWLKAKRIFHWRNNTGSSGPMFHNGKRRFVRFGLKGAPDIFAVIKGKLWGIEVKAPGNVLSDDQREFRRQMLEAGADYVVAYELSYLERVLELGYVFVPEGRKSKDDGGLPKSGRAVRKVTNQANQEQ